MLIGSIRLQLVLPNDLLIVHYVQVRAQVNKLEKDLGPFKEFTTLLRDTFQACSVHQVKGRCWIRTRTLVEN